ncbi:hypothetical protein R0381_003316 [Jeongeupia wiesaeckerbachi]|uniref:hypothetical protein n=1 Tax=Jeongeupia wiesaeckerbachi TaxID=3051218 RepID=UPI003D806D6F
MPHAAPPLQVLAPPTLLAPLQARAGQGTHFIWLPLAQGVADVLNPAQQVVLINGTLDDLQSLLRPTLRVVDVVAHGDTTQAQTHGWMIGAGGDIASLAGVTQLLDALSPPAQHAWLHLGRTGAAAFVASLMQHWQAQTLAVLGWLGGTARAQWAYDPAIWQQITQTTLHQARHDAMRYLQMTANQPFEPIHDLPAALQQYLPGPQPSTPIAPATLLAQLLLSIPAIPVSA